MRYGNNSAYLQTLVKYNDVLDKMVAGKYLHRQPQPRLPAAYPWKDVIISIGQALAAEEKGQWGKLSDVVLIPYCHVWWNERCSGCPYGIMHGACVREDSKWDLNFGKGGVSMCQRVNRARLLTVLRTGLKRGMR